MDAKPLSTHDSRRRSIVVMLVAVVLFAMMDGVAIPAATVLTRLGAPDDEWPSRTRTMDYSVRDHVFARAGLTEVALRLHDDPMDALQIIGREVLPKLR